MTLQKAIQLLESFLHHEEPVSYIALDAAISLGIEALKPFQEFRQTEPFWADFSLPGESEE